MFPVKDTKFSRSRLGDHPELRELSWEKFGKPKMLDERRKRRQRCNPDVGGIVEYVTQPEYDSATFAAGANMTKTTLFTTPLASGRNLNATNMQLAGQLPAPQRFFLRAIEFYVSNNTLMADLLALLLNCSFVFTIGKKPYMECPCLNLTAGKGAILNAFGNAGTALGASAVQYSTSNGIQAQRETYALTSPQWIEQSDTFNVVINPETAFSFVAGGATLPGVGTTFYVFLQGDLIRGVS